ncbi:MAG: hypothetical protein ACK5M3_03720 [Dysgonomonas sp.]
MKTKFLFLMVLGFSLLSIAACKSTKTSGAKFPKVDGIYDYGSPNVEQALLDHNTFKIIETSNDPTYGYSEANPIMVGKAGGNAPLNERRFLNALAGPNGEIIKYYRLGSCCSFRTKNGLLNDAGLLDKYVVTYEGVEKEIVLYINMYDSDVLKIPVGFKKKMY